MVRKEVYYVVSAIILGVVLITIAPRLLVSTIPTTYAGEERLLKIDTVATSALLPELTVTILSVFSPALAIGLVAYVIKKLKT